VRAPNAEHRNGVSPRALPRERQAARRGGDLPRVGRAGLLLVGRSGGRACVAGAGVARAGSRARTRSRARTGSHVGARVALGFGLGCRGLRRRGRGRGCGCGWGRGCGWCARGGALCRGTARRGGGSRDPGDRAADGEHAYHDCGSEGVGSFHMTSWVGWGRQPSWEVGLNGAIGVRMGCVRAVRTPLSCSVPANCLAGGAEGAPRVMVRRRTRRCVRWELGSLL
jgi:hypothetical protein